MKHVNDDYEERNSYEARMYTSEKLKGRLREQAPKLSAEFFHGAGLSLSEAIAVHCSYCMVNQDKERCSRVTCALLPWSPYSAKEFLRGWRVLTIGKIGTLRKEPRLNV